MTCDRVSLGTPHSRFSLARKPNYNFEKRNKELTRQAKKDAKREEKLRRKQEAEPEAPPASEPAADGG